MAERRAPQPARIEIAAIGVSARVIELGLNPDRTLEVPQDYSEAGWWSGGPEPGERGAAVIAGHVDSKRGPAIFYELDQLETGDKVLVERVDGSVVSFAVIGMERHSKDDFPTQRVYGQTSAPTLRLVTCSGDFNESTGHYEDNTIVFLGRA